MGKQQILWQTIVTVVGLVSLYISAVFVSFEFFYLAIVGRISIGLMYKPIFLATIYIIVSLVIKNRFPGKFLHTIVNKFLSIWLALALSLNTLPLIDSSFKSDYGQALNKFENIDGINILRDFTFYGMGLFFLVMIPYGLVIELMRDKRGAKSGNILMMALILGAVLFISNGLENGGLGKDIFLNGIKPFTIWIIGPLSLGWAGELFVQSLDKLRMKNT